MRLETFGMKLFLLIFKLSDKTKCSLKIKLGDNVQIKFSTYFLFLNITEASFGSFRVISSQNAQKGGG